MTLRSAISRTQQFRYLHFDCVPVFHNDSLRCSGVVEVLWHGWFIGLSLFCAALKLPRVGFLTGAATTPQSHY